MPQEGVMNKNIGHSVNSKLRDIARSSDTDMSTVQTRYALERFLWRLVSSPWGDQIALKGALIFVVHEGDIHRPTGDIDLNGFMADGNVDMMTRIVQEACAIECEDGIQFEPGSLQVRKRRDWSSVPEGRMELDATIGTSRVRVRIDMGFGNAITPSAELADYPGMIEGIPGPRLLVYPYETMISEKLRAMWQHGAETTRLRDYYDIWMLSQRYNFDGALLGQAVKGTFGIYEDPLPQLPLDSLSEDFVAMRDDAWDRFRSARGLKFSPPSLQETVDAIKPLLEGCVMSASGEPVGNWKAGKGWEQTPALIPVA